MALVEVLITLTVCMPLVPPCEGDKRRPSTYAYAVVSTGSVLTRNPPVDIAVWEPVVNMTSRSPSAGAAGRNVDHGSGMRGIRHGRAEGRDAGAEGGGGLTRDEVREHASDRDCEAGLSRLPAVRTDRRQLRSLRHGKPVQLDRQLAAGRGQHVASRRARRWRQMLMFAVACVASVTVMPLTVMPAPKFAAVSP